MAHPGERVLVRYADGELPEQTRSRVAVHLRQCARCRATVDALVVIRTAALRPPAAPEDQLDRILDRRASGERMLLPVVPMRRHRAWRVAAIAATAVVIGLLGVHPWSKTGEAGGPAEGACTMNLDSPSLLLAGSLLLATACAQESPSVPYEPAPPVDLLRAYGPTEGTLVYRVGRQGSRMAYESVQTLVRAGPGQGAEWLSVDSVMNPDAKGLGWQGQVRTDTVYYASDGMTPLRRARHDVRGGQERWKLQVTFGPDSVHTVNDYLGYGGAPPRRSRRSAEIRQDGVPLVLAAHEPGIGLFLQRLPLAAGWSGSFRVGPFGDGWFREESLRVEGEETIEVPAGVFDCWRLTMTPPSPPYSYRMWVTKDGQLLVKTLLGPEGHALERVLVSVDSTVPQGAEP